MLDVVAVEHCQLDGTTYTVVGTQCGTLGAQPFSVYISLDGILVKVELDIHQLVANHVHVALQDYRLAVLVAGGGGLAYQYVACLVDYSLETMVFTKLLEILNHLLLALGGAWNLIDFSKLLKHASRF